MPISIVTDSQGRRHRVEHPEGASQASIFTFVEEQVNPQGRAPRVIDAPDSFVADIGKGLFAGGSQAAVSSAAGITQWAGQTFGSNGLLEAAEDMRGYGQNIGQNIGLDQDFRESFFGQVVQGLGQIPVTLGAGAAGFVATGGNPLGAYAAAALTTGGQMTSEFLTDMEQTIGKQYTDFNRSEKDAAMKGMLTQTALGTTLELAAVGKAVRPLMRSLKAGKGVSPKALREAIEADKSALREITESAAFEGFTEAAQGQSLDTLASLLYDEDRELITMDTLKRRTMEFGVGSIVGGTVSGGVQVIGRPGTTKTKAKDLNKPVENRPEVAIPREIEVSYKPLDGNPTSIILAIEEGEDSASAAERILEGRYDRDVGLLVTEILPQEPLEVVLGETQEDILQEDVPIDPAPAPEPSPEPAPEQAPEEETSIPFQRDYRNVKVGDIFEIVGVNGKTKQVEAVGISDESGLIRFKREDGTFGITGNEVDSIFPDINSPEYMLQAAGKGTRGKLIKNLFNDELDALERDINKFFEENPGQKQGKEGAGREHIADLNAIKLERRRRAGKTQRPTPAQPTPAPEPTPRPEIDSTTGLPSFTLPQNLRKGKPGYRQTQNITFASDLERAVYSATTTTTSETGKRKRAQYRKLLEDAGYNSTEINRMGREVRAQMRNQYTGPGSPLIVTLPKDIVADAFSTYVPFRYTGKNPKETPPPFFKQFNPEEMTEGNFVDIQTGESLNNKTFASGSIRVENDRPIMETSEVEVAPLNKRSRKLGPLIKTNLFRRSAGWNWTKEPENAPQTTLVSVEQSNKHYYTTNFVSNNPLTLDPKSQATEPKGRPYTKGKLKFGNVIGEVVRAGTKSPVYDRITVGEDIVAQADPAQTQAKEETLYEFIDPFYGTAQTRPMTLDKALKEIDDEDSYERYGVLLDIRNLREYRTEEQLDQDLVAEAAPFTAPKKAPLSLVEQKDIIDIDALIDEIVENDIPVWFWYADQLGEGNFNLPNGGRVKLDAGPSYALTPANRAAGRVWASGKSAKEINNKISQLKYTDKNGKEQTGYIFLVSGSPEKMFLFNKQAFMAFYKNAFQERDAKGKIQLRKFSDVKNELLANNPPKAVRDALNSHKSLKSLMDSAASRPFIEALLEQRKYINNERPTPIAAYLKSKGFFDIENNQLRDGFFRENNFKQNDILLVVQPTKADNRKANHKTYKTPVYGKVVGVPDRKIDAFLLLPDSVRKNKEITMEPNMAAQVVAPYGARVTNIKKIVNSQQALRAVKRLREVIEDSPDGFTVDTTGEFATGGFIVAPEKGTERVIQKDKFDQKSLTKYIIDNKDALNVEGAMLGGWYNSQNGEYVLDVVFAIDNKQDAIDIAIWGDQDAFFDLDTFTEIRTKDDNQNPTTPQEDTRTASEILSRKPTQNLGEYSSQRRRDPRGVRQAVPGQAVQDITAPAAETAAENRGPQETFDNINQLEDFISKSFSSIADKMGINIYPNMVGQFVAQYNVSQKIIEYNPRALLNRSKSGVQAAMREELIHAAMHNVLIEKAKKARDSRSEDALWVDFFTALGNNLTLQERAEIKAVYQSLREGDAVAYGSEYSRAVVQRFRYGDFTEQYVMPDKGGPAFQAIVNLIRSVQAYMARILGPIAKTDPEAAQVIVDTVELLNAIDPSIRPKNQSVVANAYDAVDQNKAEENTDPNESVDAKASQRIREERRWFKDSALRRTASKFLTPIITRLNRINPMFGRILQNLDTAIRERSFRYRKRTEPFFDKINSLKGDEFLEMKQLLFFSPTPEEATHPINKAKMQRRDALLHKYGLLNMYRLDVQPILEEIYAEYTALGMPDMGYLEDYFPRVVKDLEGLINSYGQKTKRTFEMLVREENLRRSELKDADGQPAPLPEMDKYERARFFQDFLQNKFRVDINGVRLPGNVKVRNIQLIPPEKLKFYDDPGVAFGKYTENMNRAIESFKVVGDTRKGRLQGKLGELTEQLFSSGQIDQADADEVKTLTGLITAQFQRENEILKSLGTLTYMATLINPGPVLVQFMDLYKVALYRGLGGVVSGVYRTVTGNRRFDLEDDFSIAKKQLSAEFQDASVLQKALDFGLSRLVPFRQMDTAMKHASIEAAYSDFVKKAKAPVGSKKYEQLLNELTITMGREDALKTISDLRLNKAIDSPFVKEALLSELLQRQPLTYLQVPEGYQTDPSKRLFYKLSTFMLLDLNYNRREFMNDLGGPGKTLQQRVVALRRLVYMATILTLFGMPTDLLDDWIAGKDTYIPEHVMNNLLGMFGLSKYTTTRALERGAVESVIQRFTPPAVNIIVKGEQSFRSWVKGDVELFEMKAWRNSPLSDIWYNRVGAGVEQQKKLKKERRKEGIRPSIERS